MDKIIKVILFVLLIIVISITGYSMLSDDTEILPYIQLFVGVFLLVWGVVETRENKKKMGVFFFILAGLSLLAGLLNIFY